MFKISYGMGILLSATNIGLDEILDFMGITCEQLMPPSRKKWEIYAKSIDDAIWDCDKEVIQDVKYTLYEFCKGRATLMAPFTNGDYMMQICLFAAINKLLTKQSNEKCIEHAFNQVVNNRKLKGQELVEVVLDKLSILDIEKKGSSTHRVLNFQ